MFAIMKLMHFEKKLSIDVSNNLFYIGVKIAKRIKGFSIKKINTYVLIFFSLFQYLFSSYSDNYMINKRKLELNHILFFTLVE